MTKQTEKLLKILNTAYLKQQKLKYTKGNAEEFGVDFNELILVFETDTSWVILNRADFGDILNIINKKSFEMVSEEI